MSVLDHARVVIYRINQKGLEIFLVKGEDDDSKDWQIPQGNLNLQKVDKLADDERVPVMLALNHSLMVGLRKEICVEVQRMFMVLSGWQKHCNSL